MDSSLPAPAARDPPRCGTLAACRTASCAPRPTPRLVLGPLLRHVDPVSATVWVETDRPCTVRVLGRHRPHVLRRPATTTRCVVIEGLAPGSTTPYEVHLDDVPVWPPRHSAVPAQPDPHPRWPGTLPDRLRVLPVRHPARRSTSATASRPDALDSYAPGWPRPAEDEWPDALVLLGDQVYADETTPLTQAWLAARRDLSPAAGHAGRRLRGVHPAVPRVLGRPRGALAAVHRPVVDDLRRPRDDRRLEHLGGLAGLGASASPGGAPGSPAALTSYFVYQHLGNLVPGRAGRRPRPGRPSRAASADDGRRRTGAARDGRAAPTRDPHGRSAGATCGTGTASGWSWWTAGPGGCWPSRPADRSTTPSSPGWRRRCAGRSPTASTTCWSAPRCRGCSRTPSTTSSGGTRPSPSGTTAGCWAGWPSGCGRPPTWSTGRRSGGPSSGWARRWSRWPAARPDRHRRPPWCCPATCTTPTPPSWSRPAGCPAGCTS